MSQLFLTTAQRTKLFNSLRYSGVNLDKFNTVSELTDNLEFSGNQVVYIPGCSQLGTTTRGDAQLSDLQLTVPKWVLESLTPGGPGVPFILGLSGYRGHTVKQSGTLYKDLTGVLRWSDAFKTTGTDWGPSDEDVPAYVYSKQSNTPDVIIGIPSKSYSIGYDCSGWAFVPINRVFTTIRDVEVGYYSTLEDVFLDLNNNNSANISVEPNVLRYDKYKGTPRITLLSDIVLDTHITSKTDFILNLNGHTLTFDGPGELHNFHNVNVTVCDGTIVDNDYWVEPEGDLETFFQSNTYTLVTRMYFTGQKHITLTNLRINSEVHSDEALRQRHIFLRTQGAPVTLRNIDVDIKLFNTLGDTYAELNAVYSPNISYKQYRSHYLFYITGSTPNSTLEDYPDNYWKNCVVDNVRVDMNGAYSAQSYCMYIYGFNSIIRNCRLQVRNSCVYATKGTTDNNADPLFSPGTVFYTVYGNLFMEHCYVNGHRQGRAYSTTLTNTTLSSLKSMYVYNCYVHGVRDGLSIGTCPFVVGCGDTSWMGKRTRIIKGGFISSAGHGGAYTTATSGLVHWLDKTLYPNHPCGYVVDYGHNQGGTTSYGWDDEFTQFLFQDCKVGWRLKPTGPAEPTYTSACGTYLGYCSNNYSDNVRWHIDFQPGYNTHSPIVLNSRGAVVWGNINTGYVLPNGWASGSLKSTDYDYDPRKIMPLTDWQGYMMRDLKPIVLKQVFNVNTTSWTLGGPYNSMITGAVAPYIKESRPVKMYVYLQNPNSDPLKLYEKDLHFGNKDVPALSEGIEFTDPTLQIKSGGVVWVVFVPSKSTDPKADSTVYYFPHFTTDVNGAVTHYVGWKSPVAVSYTGATPTSFGYYWYDLMEFTLTAFPAPKRVQFSASNSYFRPSSILRHDGGDMYVGSGNYAGDVPITEENKSVFSTSARVHWTGENYRLPYEPPVFYYE